MPYAHNIKINIQSLRSFNPKIALSNKLIITSGIEIVE